MTRGTRGPAPAIASSDCCLRVDSREAPLDRVRPANVALTNHAHARHDLVHRQPRLVVTGYFSDDEITAVLRSWEERFGAVVSVMTGNTLEFAVGAPPRDDDQARRLADEHAALMPDADPQDLQELVVGLRSTHGRRGFSSARYWALGWPD